MMAYDIILLSFTYMENEAKDLTLDNYGRLNNYFRE